MHTQASARDFNPWRSRNGDRWRPWCSSSSSIEGLSLVVVHIGSSGAQFGENGKGFTITGEPPAVRDVDSFGLTWVRGDIQ